MQRALVVLVMSSALVAGCTSVKEGPPVELVDVAVPKVVSDAALAPKPVPSPPLPIVSRSGFRAWIPRVVTRNGDVYEGHYVDVSDKAPQKELTKPDYEIPKAPKQIYRPAVKRDTPSGLGTTGTPPGRSLPSVPPAGSPPPAPPVPQEGGYEPGYP